MPKSEKPVEPATFPVETPPIDTEDMWSASQVTPEASAALAGTVLIATVPVKKPRNGQFVWVHAWDEKQEDPARAWCRRVYSVEKQVGLDKELYLLNKKLLGGEGMTPEIPKEFLIVAYFAMDGGPCLWPLRLPGDKSNNWIDTALDAATNYSNRWIKLVADMGSGSYRVHGYNIQRSVPRWPEGGFKYLFETAFKNRLINDMAHPVLREKTGQA